MSKSVTLDPSFQIAKVFIRLGMIFSAAMVALLIYLIYLASLGIFQEWEMEIMHMFEEFDLETAPFFLQAIMLSFPIVGFIVAFIVLGWLDRRIKEEGKSFSSANSFPSSKM